LRRTCQREANRLFELRQLAKEVEAAFDPADERPTFVRCMSPVVALLRPTELAQGGPLSAEERKRIAHSEVFSVCPTRTLARAVQRRAYEFTC